MISSDAPESCPRCGKPADLCVCAALRELPTSLHVLILQHPQEPDKEIGTADLTAGHGDDEFAVRRKRAGRREPLVPAELHDRLARGRIHKARIFADGQARVEFAQYR